jgi:hypothetical protein
LFSPATLELAEGYVEVKPLGPLPVKGLPEPMEVCELVGAGAVRSRLHAAAGRGLTRFVGRDSEVDQLRQALERAQAGHGQVVAVVGEPGVGKSASAGSSPPIAPRLAVLEAGPSLPQTGLSPVIDLLKAFTSRAGRTPTIREKSDRKSVLDRPGAPLRRALAPGVPVRMRRGALDPHSAGTGRWTP